MATDCNSRYWFTKVLIVLVGYTLTPPDYGVIWGITFRYILPSAIAFSLCLPMGTDITDAVAKKIAPICVYVVVCASITTWISAWSIQK